MKKWEEAIISYCRRSEEQLLEMSLTELHSERKLANLDLRNSKEMAEFKKAREKFENSEIFKYSKLVDDTWSERIDAPDSLKDRVKKRFSVKRESVDRISFNNEKFMFGGHLKRAHDVIREIEPYNRKKYLEKRNSDSFKIFDKV
tara:strand:+ start:333 stop:767 length:435 start_codon:yes stop_codon:yes gene_type:complete